MRLPIEAVTVCVDYADFLREIAPHNRPLLDRWIVVTRPQDEATRRVCGRHSIECVLTEDFDREPEFAKAHGINAGLRQCRGNGWLLHLDGDIALPEDFHACIEDAQLAQGSIYGALRLCVPGEAAWDEVRRQGLYSRQFGWLTEYRNRPAGCYVGGVPAGIGIGYAPIGYFQLWWGAETLSWSPPPQKWYPARHSGAARTDSQFAWQWDRRRRHLIPELLVFHVEAENAKDGMGHNWKGRKTPPFRAADRAGAGAATAAGKHCY